MNPLSRLFIDPLRPSAEAAPEAYRLNTDDRSWLVPVAIGAVMLVIGLVLGLAGSDGDGLLSTQFYFSYLTAYAFCLTIALGCLFFVMIQHITKSAWSVTVRRLPEVIMMSFPLLALLALPIVFGMHDLYHWTHEDLYVEGGPHYDEILAGKRAYLNTPFFLVRLALYFAVWIFLSYRLYRLSVRQDVDPRPGTAFELRRVSAYGLPLFAITTSFSAYDLLMSLDPHWFSTMFGVYVFAGAFFVALATITLFALLLQRNGAVPNTITLEHYHDLGKFMFAFTVFWAYIAFSQYMLIWYSNLPEETLWYRHRLEHGWEYLSVFLLVGHFILPFLILIFRFVKRTRLLLGLMTIWFLFIHYADLYWITMPTMGLGTDMESHFAPGLLDLTLWLGLVFVFIGTTVYRVNKHSLVPFNDPYFERSVAFENA